MDCSYCGTGKIEQDFDDDGVVFLFCTKCELKWFMNSFFAKKYHFKEIENDEEI